jgi:hypothetical protein
MADDRFRQAGPDVLKPPSGQSLPNRPGWHTGRVSTKDEAHASTLTGEALLAAQDESFQPLLDRLAEVAEGRDDLRAQVAGGLAGTWFARPESHQGHELIAAGLLILAGVTDRGLVGKAVRVGYERGASLEGYDPSG